MRFLVAIFWAAFSCAIPGCASLPQDGRAASPKMPDVPSGITEVSLKGSTGHLGSSFAVTFRRDGGARCECTFYDLDETGEPKFEYPESLCGRLFINNRNAFEFNASQNLEAIFVGNLSGEQFEETAALIIKNGFLAMKEEYLETGLSEPPDVTRVVFAGKVKKVTDNGTEGDEKLSQIKRSIYDLALRTGWRNDKK